MLIRRAATAHLTARTLAARTLTACVLTGAVLLTGTAPASAATTPPGTGGVDCTANPTVGSCDLTAGSGGSQGGGTSDPGGGGGGGGTPTPCVYRVTNTVIPCVNPAGYPWVTSLDCYVAPLTPLPPFSDPWWQGHTTGSLYTCGPLIGPPRVIWLPTPPAAQTDPAVLAQQAVTNMRLTAIRIGSTPSPAAGAIGYVGLPTYLWVDNPDAQTFGPFTRQESAGGVTVTATARVQEIRWSMGDGGTVVCAGPGTPYQDVFGSRPSPDCGYTYTRPRDPYTVTATSHWVITWAGAGRTGTIALDLVATTQLRIGEVQVLVR